VAVRSAALCIGVEGEDRSTQNTPKVKDIERNVVFAFMKLPFRSAMPAGGS